MAKDNSKKRMEDLGAIIERLAESTEETNKQRSEENDRAKKRDLANKTIAGLTAAHTKALVTSVVSLVSFNKLFGGLANDNTNLVKTLVSTQQMNSVGMAKFNESFKNVGLDMRQSVAAMGEITTAGLGKSDKNTIGFLARVKALGFSLGTMGEFIKMNSQRLGISSDKSIFLADTLISTAAQNGIHADKMVSVINAMKNSLVKASVAFGPNAAVAMQTVASQMVASMGQEFSDVVGQFIADYTTGSRGMIRAAMLGVDPIAMTRGEDGMQAGMEQIARKIVELRSTAGNGFETPFILEAFEKQYGITQEQFNLAQKIMDEHGGSLVNTAEILTEQMQEERRKNDADVTYRETLKGLQNRGVDLLQNVGKTLEGMGTALYGWIGAGFVAGLYGPAIFNNIHRTNDSEKTRTILQDIRQSLSGQRLDTTGGKIAGAMKGVGAIAGVAMLATQSSDSGSSPLMQMAYGVASMAMILPGLMTLIKSLNVKAAAAAVFSGAKWVWDKWAFGVRLVMGQTTNAILTTGLAAISLGATVIALGVGAIALSTAMLGENVKEGNDAQTNLLTELRDFEADKQKQSEVNNPLVTIARDMALNTALLGELAVLRRQSNESQREALDVARDNLDINQSAADHFEDNN
jgi:hypothetical protein